MLKIFDCLKGVRSRFKVRRVNRFLLLSAVWLGVIAFPGGVSAQVVDIPDPNLRAAIAEALDKPPGDAITRADMETLGKLRAGGRDITDLRGIEFAINLTVLDLFGNTISDISPLASLTNLIELNLEYNTISDISTVAGLTNLERLWLWRNNISDISAVAGLTNLTELYLGVNTIPDISAVAGLTNLERLWLGGNTISDISPLSSLTNLRDMQLSNNTISDISPLAKLTNLRWLELDRNTISDISPLANLTNLRWLELQRNTISDISAVATLTNLTNLELSNNTISDISAVAILINLTLLDLKNNQIRDVFPLIGLINLERLLLAGNPIEDASPLRGLIAQNPGVDVDIFWPPKITGPWLWMIAPTEPGQGGAASTDVDSLADASGGTVTETDVAINGASMGDTVGNYAWTPAEISDTSDDNVTDVVNTIGFAQGDVDDHSSYALINFTSATDLSGVRMHVGSDDSIKVWLNGEVVHTKPINRASYDFQDMFRVDLVAGNNLLLVKVSERAHYWSMFVGIDAEITLLSPAEPIGTPLDINADGQVNVLDLVLVAVFYGTRGDGLPADVNADGIVNVQDFAAVAAGVDAATDLSPQAIEDMLVAAIEQAGALEGLPGAPMGFGNPPRHILTAGIAARNVAAALADVKHLAIDDVRLREGLETLLSELLQLLAEMGAIPETTALLANYPNPFNPETWIPYHLAIDAAVTLTIYDGHGRVVRVLDFGHQRAGIYQSREQAAYWDGRNQIGEKVASGLYFYTLTADDFNATRKLLIAK